MMDKKTLKRLAKMVNDKEYCLFEESENMFLKMIEKMMKARWKPLWETHKMWAESKMNTVERVHFVILERSRHEK